MATESTNPGSPPKLPPKPAFSLTWLTTKVSGILRRNSQTQVETKKSDEQSDEQHVFVPNEGRRESGAGDTNSQTAAAEVVPDSLPNAKRLHNSLDKYWIFRVIEDKTGIPKLYTAFFFSLCMAVLGVYLMGIRKTSNTIAFVYPAYMSYRTLEMDSYEEHAYWLTYWLVYGVVDIMDGFFDSILFWLPYYELLKFMFLFWLFLPKFKGCATIYSYIIRPVLVHNEEGIDSTLTATGDKLGKATGELRNMSGELIATVLALFIKTLAMGVHKVGDAAVGGNAGGGVPPTPSSGQVLRERRSSNIDTVAKKLS